MYDLLVIKFRIALVGGDITLAKKEARTESGDFLHRIWRAWRSLHRHAAYAISLAR